MHSLVEMEVREPHIWIDVPYAREDNFMGEVLYDCAVCFLHEDAAERVYRVAEKLKSRGLGLLLWDGFRPVEVQQRMWDKIQDPRYVSNPAESRGRHTRGTAVDVTLVDFEGRQLEMPTAFDSFEERAHADYAELPDGVRKNRELLREVMGSEGFHVLPTEWWHFDLEGWEEYPVVEVSLSELVATAP